MKVFVCQMVVIYLHAYSFAHFLPFACFDERLALSLQTADCIWRLKQVWYACRNDE